MTWKLDPEELYVTSFETGATDALVMDYTPDCCTDDMSGCQTGPEVTCRTDEPDCATDDPAVCPTVDTQVEIERIGIALA